MKGNIFLILGAMALASFSSADVNLICRLAPGVSATDVASSYGISVVDTTAGAPFVLFSAVDSTKSTAVRNSMLLDSRVLWSEDDTPITAPEGQKGSTLPAVGDRATLVNANQFYLRQINWNPFSASLAGRGVRVAILDTGLSAQLPALWRKVAASANFVEPGTAAIDQPLGTDSNQDGRADALTGHGSMVAGIVDQISPNSQLVIARIADSDGNATTWRLIKGLAFAATQGAEIANVSLGTLSKIPALTDVLDWTGSLNLTVVASAGNNGINDLCYPARIRNAIAVGGLGATNSKASFSNWDRQIAVSAPAIGIFSYDWNGQISYWSGTSFSAPMVSGAIAEYLRFAGTKGTPSRINNALKSSVTNIDRFNPSYKSMLGGLLDCTKLLGQARK